MVNCIDLSHTTESYTSWQRKSSAKCWLSLAKLDGDSKAGFILTASDTNIDLRPKIYVDLLLIWRPTSPRNYLRESPGEGEGGDGDTVDWHPLRCHPHTLHTDCSALMGVPIIQILNFDSSERNMEWYLNLSLFIARRKMMILCTLRTCLKHLPKRSQVHNHWTSKAY